VGQNLLSVVVPVNARAVWRQHVTSLVDTALGGNDAVLDDVSAAIARTVLSGGQVYAFGAGHSISLVNEMYRRAGSFRIMRPVWNAEMVSPEDEEAKGLSAPPADKQAAGKQPADK
jgi:uncharacterized phosphosugar-binding protein